MAVYLFRINGGQVLGVSIDATAYAGIDTSFFSTISNPPTPNGTDLSIPKIWDGTNLRNATAAEITSFATAATTDANLQARVAAIHRLQTDPIFRKALSAIVDVTVQQLNVLRAAVIPALSPITKAQAINAIVNAINSGADD
jgi:hypothetical protein